MDCNSSSSQKNKYHLSCATNEQVINALYNHTVMMQANFTQLINDKPAHPMNPIGSHIICIIIVKNDLCVWKIST